MSFRPPARLQVMQEKEERMTEQAVARSRTTIVPGWVTLDADGLLSKAVEMPRKERP
jgi:hypothetical protein